MQSETTWRYDRLTWPQMRAALARDPQPVVAIPIGAVEDHGAHLPISTDNDILAGVLAECGRRASGDLLVLPTIPFGLDEHHMDFPGTIAIDIETTLAYLPRRRSRSRGTASPTSLSSTAMARTTRSATWPRASACWPPA